MKRHPPKMFVNGIPYDDYRCEHPLSEEQIEANRVRLLKEFAPEFLEGRES